MADKVASDEDSKPTHCKDNTELAGILFKLVTLLVFLACAGLATYQSTKSIIRFYEDTVVTSVTERDLQPEDYPYIVVCSHLIIKKMADNITDIAPEFQTIFSPGPIFDFMKTYPWETINLEQYEERLSDYPIEYELGLAGGTFDPPLTAMASHIYSSTRGICAHFRPWKKKESARGLNMKMLSNGTYTLRMVHSLDEIRNVYGQFKYGMAYTFAHLNGENVGFHLEVKRKTRISTNEFKCSEEKGYSATNCFEKCFSTKLLQNNIIMCSLPWMKKRVDAPLCDSLNTSSQLFEALDKEDDIDDYDEYCNKQCPEACTNVVYTLQETVTKHTTMNDNVITFIIDPTMKIVDEVVAYGFINVVGDVGGIVGILLGYSLFGVVQMLINALQHKMTTSVNNK